jgi:glucose-6-phosphate 1-epimerase
MFSKGPGGLDVLNVRTPDAEARVFLHGAQLTHWQPRGASPVIFTSDKSKYQQGTAIRGGVPVCLPWFGPREGSQAHGFMRNRMWEVGSVNLGSDGRVDASFVTRSDSETLAMWPHEFSATLTYRIGTTLEMELEVVNASAEPFTFSQALHTYFVVGDASQVRVDGLHAAKYRDFPDRTQLTVQQGSVTFSEETDRVYVDTAATCVLVDPVLGRRITVQKSGSGSTVVWNPWATKAAGMADLGDDEWPSMVCIETANAFENSVALAPNASHRMTVSIDVSSDN